MTDVDVGRLLARSLRAAGVDQLYGAAFPGLDVVVPGPSASVARTLADAHVRVHGTWAGVHLGDGRFVLGDAQGERAVALTVDSARDLPDAVAHAMARLGDGRGSYVELDVALDPGAPAPDLAGVAAPAPATWAAVDDAILATVRTAARPMVLAGPGVVSGGAVADLHSLAASADLGVLNSWGAKGLFDWRSRHHWATVGLQELDLELGGVAESDLVVLTGLDDDETDPHDLVGRPTVVVSPGMLGPLAEQWTRPRGELDVPRLRHLLAEVTQRGWTNDALLLPPSRVTLDYAQIVAAPGFVAADPGIAGYWVARTFATSGLGGAKVPARRGSQGAAVACATVARLRGPARRVLAVADGPLDEAGAEMLDAAGRLDVTVALELWDPAGPRLDADAHLARLATLLDGDQTSLVSLATDPTQLGEMVAAAGPVTAWGGLVHELVEGGGPA